MIAWATIRFFFSKRLGPLLGDMIRSPIFWIVVSIALAYWGFTERSRANENESKLAVEVAKNTSLKQANAILVTEKTTAYEYADLTRKQTYATRDSIKKVVLAMPASERTKLNRQLLSELELLK